MSAWRCLGIVSALDGLPTAITEEHQKMWVGKIKKTAVCVCVCVKDQVDAPTHSSKEMYPGPADCPGKQSRYLCGGGCLLGVPAAHTNSARTARTASSVGGCFGIVVRNVAWVCADICVGSTAQHNSVD